MSTSCAPHEDNMARTSVTLLSFAVIIALIAVGTSATAVRGSRLARRARAMRGATTTSAGTARAPPNAVVLVTLLLNHGDEESIKKLDEHFWAVSNPDSPRRGQYLSKAEVGALMAAKPEAVREVRAWLYAAGVSPKSVVASPWGDHLFVNTTVRVAEALLGVDLEAVPVAADGGYRRVGVAGGASAAPRPGHPLAAPHVHRVTVGGRLPPIQQAQQEERALQNQPPPYPFTFYPPPLATAVEALPAAFSQNGNPMLELDFMLTCPGTPWNSVEIPLTADDDATIGSLNGPGSDVLAPCSPSGQTSRVKSFEVTLTPTTNLNGAKTITKSVAYKEATQADPQGCTSTEYAIPIGTSGEGVRWPVAECIFAFDDVALVEDVQYELQIQYTFKDGSTQQATYKATPSEVPLHVQSMNLKVPATLNTDYSVPSSATVCDPDTQSGVMVLQDPGNGYYSDDDLRTYLQAVGLDAAVFDAVHWVGKLQDTQELEQFMANNGITGPNRVQRDQSNPGGETTLDVQWLASMAPGAYTTVWHGGYFSVSAANGGGVVDAMYATLIAVQFDPKPPQVISISYGGVEPPPQYGSVAAGNMFFQALGTMGITVVVSSGDTGPYLSEGDVQQSCAQFLPSWPATSPYVLAAGATQKGTVSGAEGHLPASIAYGAGITTGGGFSDQNPRPTYQNDAVEGYLATATLPQLTFNRTGRGYPDVGLYGHSFIIVLGGQPQPVDGTSASAPAMAGMLSLMNDGIKRLGGTSMGFINPTLYKMAVDKPSAFIDVTTGDNKCMGQGAPATCCKDGYEAAVGWDPVSGLGSVVFSEAFPYIASSVLQTTVTAFPATPDGCTTANTACKHTCTGTCDAQGTCSGTHGGNDDDSAGSDSGTGIGSGSQASGGIDSWPAWYFIVGGAGITLIIVVIVTLAYRAGKKRATPTGDAYSKLEGVY